MAQINKYCKLWSTVDKDIRSNTSKTLLKKDRKIADEKMSKYYAP